MSSEWSSCDSYFFNSGQTKIIACSIKDKIGYLLAEGDSIIGSCGDLPLELENLSKEVLESTDKIESLKSERISKNEKLDELEKNILEKTTEIEEIKTFIKKQQPITIPTKETKKRKVYKAEG